MKIKTFAAKAARYLFTGATTTGVVTAVGLVSVAGATIISPALGLAVGAFVFGGLAEGEAFFQSISGGIKSLALLGKRGYHDLMIEALHRDLGLDKPREKRKRNQSRWLQYYSELYDAVEQFNADASNNAWNRIKLTQEQQMQQAKAKKRLALMQAWFVEQVLATKRGELSNDPVNEDNIHQANPLPRYSYDQDPNFNTIITQLSQKNWRLKQWIIRLGLPIGIISGSGFALLSSAFLPGALAALGLSAAFVWPLIAAAGIGGAFLIYHNIRDMIVSGWFDRCKNTLKKLFKVPAEGVTVKYVLKIVSLGILATALATLFVFSFLGSFGLSWPAMKAGAAYIPHLAKAAKWIRNCIGPVFFGANATFSITNAGTSLDEIVRFYRERWQHLKNTYFNRKFLWLLVNRIKRPFRELYKRENILQIIDPFRFVSKVVLKLSVLLMYLGHVAAGGTGGDKFGKLPTALLATASAGNEALQDGPFFWKESKQTITYKLVKGALFALHFLSAGYQVLTSRLNDDRTKKQLSFKQALKNAFDWPEKVKNMSSPLPTGGELGGWSDYEIKSRFQKRINHTCNEQEKRQLINACDALISQRNEEKPELLQDTNLNEHCLINTRATLFSPKNDRFVREMTQQYSPKRLR